MTSTACATGCVEPDMQQFPPNSWDWSWFGDRLIHTGRGWQDDVSLAHPQVSRPLFSQESLGRFRFEVTVKEGSCAMRCRCSNFPFGIAWSKGILRTNGRYDHSHRTSRQD